MGHYREAASRKARHDGYVEEAFSDRPSCGLRLPATSRDQSLVNRRKTRPKCAVPPSFCRG
jgi:hypothetical protein